MAKILINVREIMVLEMLLFAHLGITLALGRFIAARYALAVNLLFLGLGSMLPDIIDKPLGLLLYGTPNMGRIYCHTLLFLLIMAALTAYSRDLRLISLTGGVLVHLVLDFMWNSPVILFWPLLGPFPTAVQLDAMSYLQRLLLGLRNPAVLVPECLGLAEVVYLALTMQPSVFARMKMALRSIADSRR